MFYQGKWNKIWTCVSYKDELHHHHSPHPPTFPPLASPTLSSLSPTPTVPWLSFLIFCWALISHFLSAIYIFISFVIIINFHLHPTALSPPSLTPQFACYTQANPPANSINTSSSQRKNSSKENERNATIEKKN